MQSSNSDLNTQRNGFSPAWRYLNMVLLLFNISYRLAFDFLLYAMKGITESKLDDGNWLLLCAFPFVSGDGRFGAFQLTEVKG